MKIVKTNKYIYYIKKDSRGVKNGMKYHGVVVCMSSRDPDLELDVTIGKRLCSVSNPYRVLLTKIFEQRVPSFSATAYCSEDDEFDESKGMSVARQRVVDKIKKYKLHRLAQVYKYLEDSSNIIEDLLNK